MKSERLEEIIAYLKENPQVECDPYPNYDRRVTELLSSLGVEEEYQEKFDEASEKPVEEMSLNDLKAMYTFISRGERFCDGHIKAYVEDGTLLRLAERQREMM